jgi:hypothetical protein
MPLVLLMPTGSLVVQSALLLPLTRTIVTPGHAIHTVMPSSVTAWLHDERSRCSIAGQHCAMASRARGVRPEQNPTTRCRSLGDPDATLSIESSSI